MYSGVTGYNHTRSIYRWPCSDFDFIEGWLHLSISRASSVLRSVCTSFDFIEFAGFDVSEQSVSVNALFMYVLFLCFCLPSSHPNLFLPAWGCGGKLGVRSRRMPPAVRGHDAGDGVCDGAKLRGFHGIVSVPDVFLRFFQKKNSQAVTTLSFLTRCF